ncbi:arylalkylamine N-acetyltransferase-like 2 isoform X1 [Neodiprion pinetum]|uniref:arylalkylamine N-acetyltransferase-like 2 isoform X1 n=2 Tax=Neodiprion pinetum TaxID=441929 RepID=UPI001EDE906B|nr:arylalkylamine N-acetyltransferase-like 2 isoform X1 [Neodiprion pinetum]
MHNLLLFIHLGLRGEHCNRKRMPSYRLWGSTEDGEVEFESLTTETLEDALQMLRDSFFKDESICQGVDLLSEPGAADELIELCRLSAKDGVSVVAVEVCTGRVVGVSFNKIQTLAVPGVKGFFEIFAENCKCDSSRELMDFMVDVDSRLNLFEHYNVDTLLEVMFLGTAISHRRRRIGELIVAASIELGKQLKAGKDVKTPVEIHGVESIANKDATPKLCSLICSSLYSYKICKNLGFDTLVTVSLADYEFKGKKYVERIRDNKQKSASLVAKRL